MSEHFLLLPVFIPALVGLIVLLIPDRITKLKEILAIIVTIVNSVICWKLLQNSGEISFIAPWANFGLDFAFRLYNFNAFIIFAISCFFLLIAVYSFTFMVNKNCLNQFFAYFLFTLAMANGAVLSDNLAVMLFFWEGLLLTLFGMIIIGRREAFRTAIKAMIVSGVGDICLMLGIGLTYLQSNTLTISKISLPVDGLSGLAFLFLFLGAISKAGAMPFHSWIPDAAVDSPLPFMALLPGALEKLLGIYFLTRISLDMFKIETGSWASMLMMTVGAITIIFAVMMALIQKDYKRLLSYHAISQVGYMVLGIGTGIKVGIVGGLFHMLNNAIYKCCLFLTGGAVEHQTGTTDLKKLGGLISTMPITGGCFIIAACSISGVPPFNGFFSKELVYDGALKAGVVFYLAALIGSFFTSASFLKLGHAVFFGAKTEHTRETKEAPLPILIPIVVLSLACIVFGLFNHLAIDPIQNFIVSEKGELEKLSGWPHDFSLVVISLLFFAGAIANHFYGVRKTGMALKAADHIHHAPVLCEIYDQAERRFFDPYDIGIVVINVLSEALWVIDRGIDWVYEVFTVEITSVFSLSIRNLHRGNFSTYLLWSLIGGTFILMFLMKSI